MSSARQSIAGTGLAALVSACLSLDTSGPGAATTGTTDAAADAETTDPASSTIASSGSGEDVGTTMQGTTSSSGATTTAAASDASSGTTGEGTGWIPFGDAVPVPGLSGPADERSPSQSTDGLLHVLLDGRVRQFQFEAGTWTQFSMDPVHVAINERPGLTTPRVSQDGLYIYFSDTSEGSLSARRWNFPLMIVPVGVGSKATDERGFAVDPTRTMALYVSDEAGSDDLYSTTRPDVNSVWGPSSPVADANGPGTERSPTLALGGTALLFVSDSHMAGAASIYRLSEGNQGEPVLVGELSDALLPEIDVWLAPDARTVFLTRENAQGTADLYTATR